MNGGNGGVAGAAGGGGSATCTYFVGGGGGGGAGSGATTRWIDPAPGYRCNLPPVPWIFRGDVNKSFFVLLAMEAPLALLGALAHAFGW